MSYEIGVVYVWQNQVGEMEHLNGTDVMVLEEPKLCFCLIKQEYTWGQVTDAECPCQGDVYFAEVGDLRRKQPPSGELSILNMFVVAPPQRTKEIA